MINNLFQGSSKSFEGYSEILAFAFIMITIADTEWSELRGHSAVFSMQGMRDGNEDRAVIKRVKTVEGLEESDDEAVHIWAVMDGHGGEVSVVNLNFHRWKKSF